ncbi:MAG: RNA polymerase factor sigma-54 [Bdellovibrio sp.]
MAKISQGLGLKQTQQLTMTPELQQAIKLLTLTHQEMTNMISEEMVENPMLEEIDVEGDSQSGGDEELSSLEAEVQEVTAENFERQDDFVAEKDDFDFQSYIDSYNSNSSQPLNMATPDSEDGPSYENIVSKGQTLPEHLIWQLRMDDDLTPEEFQFAEFIIHNINDDGYLELPFEEILSKTGFDRDRGFDILEIIQSLDPVGCGAEDLVDCLLAQARIAEERSPLLEKIIREHLKDLQNSDHQKIAKSLGVSLDSVQAAAEVLKTFHPRPGRLITPGETQYVTPDIYVVEIGGEFVVKVNDDGVPRLRISKMYRDMLEHGNAEAKDFVQEKLKSAMWLIKSIQKRQKTIFRVAKAIVRSQQDFFKKGPRYLKPMILKDIANEIGMHESTVSRVTTNKFMHTPIGMFELKYFFNSGIGGKEGGLDVTSEVLKIKIKELVERENPKKPLSDDKIAELLSRDDVKVARRTVAKYREMMDIPSSAKRKLKT